MSKRVATFQSEHLRFKKALSVTAYITKLTARKDILKYTYGAILNTAATTYNINPQHTLIFDEIIQHSSIAISIHDIIDVLSKAGFKIIQHDLISITVEV